MQNNQKVLNEKPIHAPGAGSDKEHPETPGDANDRFKKQEKEDVQKHPEDQNTG